MRNPRREARASDKLAGSSEASTPKQTAAQRWQAANPKARWAHVALHSALKRGLLQRQPCEVCGDVQTDGHHPDYDKPLAVIWLCRRHHKQAHRKRAANGQ
jgi:hypothetical protein